MVVCCTAAVPVNQIPANLCFLCRLRMYTAVVWYHRHIAKSSRNEDGNPFFFFADRTTSMCALLYHSRQQSCAILSSGIIYTINIKHLDSIRYLTGLFGVHAFKHICAHDLPALRIMPNTPPSKETHRAVRVRPPILTRARTRINSTNKSKHVHTGQDEPVKIWQKRSLPTTSTAV